MNWIHFILWLAGIYCLYYLLVILWDTLKAKKTGSMKAATHELTFSEQVTPHDATGLLEDENSLSADEQVKSMPEMIASGGVLLKDVFSLARKEAIVYLKEVSF